MAPRPRAGESVPNFQTNDFKNAAVLILLYPAQDDLRFLLTLRTDKVESHKGQVSLPGGAQEDGESLRETALRETCEELHLDRATIKILGEPLSTLTIPVSGYRVTPYVGYSAARPIARAAPDEVMEIIETPLEWIVDDARIREEFWEMPRYAATVPFFAINAHKVWGATAMMLSEFREMLLAERKRFNSKPVQDKRQILTRVAENRAQIRALGVGRLRLFGSFVRDQQNSSSDVDVIVEFARGKKSFDNFIQLVFLLEKLFQRRVELVTPESLSPYLRPAILKEVLDVPLGA